MPTQTPLFESVSFNGTIALIGCITGCLGFFLSVYNLWKERYCLKIEFKEGENLFFPSITQKKYLSDCQAIVHIVIRNKSVSPLTIHDGYVLVDGIYTRFEEYTDDTRLALPIPNDPSVPSHLLEQKSFLTIPMDKQLVFPLRLDARDSRECMGFIPIFPHESGDSVSIQVILNTAIRKKHLVKTTVFNYTLLCQKRDQ